MSQNEEKDQNVEEKDQNAVEKDQNADVKDPETSDENIPDEPESVDQNNESQKEETHAIDSKEDAVPTLEEVSEALAAKEAEVIRLKEALIAGDKEIQDLQSRLRSVSTAYKKEKEDQEAFKLRIERQMEYRSSRRRGEVVKVLFEPLENLRRSHNSLHKKDPELAVGVEMVIKAFMTGFTKLGLEEISPDGQKFNPNEHNALMVQPTPDPALDDIILQTYSVGYRIEGLILQPAQVIVGKYDGPPIQEEQEDSEQEDANTEAKPEEHPPQEDEKTTSEE